MVNYNNNSGSFLNSRVIFIFSSCATYRVVLLMSDKKIKKRKRSELIVNEKTEKTETIGKKRTSNKKHKPEMEGGRSSNLMGSYLRNKGVASQKQAADTYFQALKLYKLSINNFGLSLRIFDNLSHVILC